ncbi:hypothetical protein DFH29DRAFT_995447 [Suillus ampliporus]|nr:hypothetical protein DFH29DRAFT_995447 [Suillus ampliporus]
MGALEAPSDNSIPPIGHTGSDPHTVPLITSEDSGGSAMMSISPLLESVVGQRYSQLEQPVPSTAGRISYDHGRHSPRMLEKLTWADLPNDDELGKVPEFPVLSPLIESHSAMTLPRIPYESKGKSIEPKSKNTTEDDNPNEWYQDWTSTGNGLLERSKPDHGGTVHEFGEQANLVGELRDRVHELEKTSYTKPSTTSTISNQRSAIKTDPDHSKTSSRTPLENKGRNATAIPTNSRYQRASSVLPQTSSVKQAMMGAGPLATNPDPSDSSSDSLSDGEQSSSESNLSETSIIQLDKPQCTESPRKARKGSPCGDPPTNDFGADFLAIEPESDHDSDSAETKRNKRMARREYRAKLNLLKYQQSFIKNEPPFTYTGEANTTTFKKWVREVRDWKDRARLTTNQSLRMLGKYLSGQAYRFYERDILDLQKGYTLTEFFEQLFDYIFPPDFRMQQRQKFAECRQEPKQSVRDYLRRLRNLTDTAGDVDDREMVRQFWMNCHPYLKASLVDKGYELNMVSINVIEKKALHTERAFLENSKDPNILLAINPTLATSLAHCNTRS